MKPKYIISSVILFTGVLFLLRDTGNNLQKPSYTDPVILTEEEKAENASLITKVELLREEHLSLSLTNQSLKSLLLKYEKKQDNNKPSKYERDAKLIEKNVLSELKKYRILLKLTPEQESEILALAMKAALSIYAEHKYVSEQKVRAAVEKDVKSLFSEEQLEIYAAQDKHQKGARAEFTANYVMSYFPVTLNFSEKQKDFLYSKIYNQGHSDTKQKISDNLKKISKEYNDAYDTKFEGLETYLIWAVQDVATDEQMEALIKSFIRTK